MKEEIDVISCHNDNIRNINTSISQGGLVRIELFYRDEEGDHQLAIAPMVASVMQ